MPHFISVTENGFIESDRDFSEPAHGTVIVPDSTFQALRQLAFDTDGADSS
jgi:hypothetical protein